MIIKTFNLSDNYRPHTRYLPCNSQGELNPTVDVIISKGGRFVSERTGIPISIEGALNEVSGYYKMVLK